MNHGDAPPMIWVPRPIEDAVAISAELRDLGMTPLVEPVMTIRYHDTVPDMTDVAALLFTSANGVRAFIRSMPDRHLPVYAVGQQTAETARAAGFTTIVTAGGDVEKLAESVAGDRPPEDGILLHIAASERAGDLSGLLEGRGFTVKRAELYSAVIVDTLPEPVSRVLAAGEISAVLLFSPRTAEAVSRLIREAGQDPALRAVHALCLSDAVAGKLSSQQWASVTVADEPSRSSALLALQKAMATTTIANSGEPGTGIADEISQQKDGTETSGTPTLATHSDRTHAISTSENKKPEGAADTMNAEHVIEKFGGIRPMAQKLGIAVSTVQGWKTRNHIPENRWDDVRAAAISSGIDLDDASAPSEDAAVSDMPEMKTENPWQESNADTPESDESTLDAHPADADAPLAADTQPSEPPPPEKPEAVAPPPPVAPAKSTRSGSGGWALFLAIVALAGIATRGYWGPAIDPKVEAHLTNFFGPPVKQQATAVDETIQTDLVRTQEVIGAILRRLENIEQGVSSGDGVDSGSVVLGAVNDRIAALESRLDSAATVAEDGTIDLTALESALSALRTRMEALDGKTDTAVQTAQMDVNTFRDQLTAISNDLDAVNTQIGSLGERLALLENTPGNPAISSAALVLAIGQLETIADTGASFSDALPGLRELAGNEADILSLVDTLKEASWSGVTTVSVLSDRFSKIAATVDAAETSAVDGDWIDESFARLQSVVSVRRIDEAPDAPAASKAEAALARGDLAAAIAFVEPYRNADETIADWLDDAEARLAVDTAISKLRANAIDRLRAMATTN